MTGVILLIVGFGFVIFVHELGHFLAAKAVGVKVEQFALGFGQALICWRKGIGFAVGNTAKQFDRRVRQHIESRQSGQAAPKDKADLTTEQINQAARELGLGETEYRLNWIPLGGYVKMLGQDDLNPNAKSPDPRSFNAKSIGARMIVVSAGVIMNIIFGTLGFMVVFMMGMKVPPTIVGGILPQSPAQEAVTMDGKPAPLHVGDRILKINGAIQHDFSKIVLNTALARAGDPLTLLVQRTDGTEQEVRLTPRASAASSSGFLMIGIEMARELRAPALTNPKSLKEYEALPAEARPLRPGETIVAVNGNPVKIDEINKLDDAVQASGGEPVQLTVQAPGGTTRQVSLKPEPAMPFDGSSYAVAGMRPRAVIESVMDGSPAKGRIESGDVIVAIHTGNDVRMNPSFEEFRSRVTAAGQANKTVDLTVLRKGQEVEVKGLMPTVNLESGKGLGVRAGVELDQVVLAAVDAGSPAVSLPPGSTIRSIAGQSMKNWASVLNILQQQQPDTDIAVEAIGPSGDPNDIRKYTIRLGQQDVQSLARHRYTYSLVLHDMTRPRTAPNAAVAALWGVGETRDFILQSYSTLRRMTEGSVSPKALMGPVGIFQAGTMFADKGTDYLIWFLAMISANLAVVNFLPIPIVDGGLFTFLLIEKIKGSPVSDRMQMLAQYVGIGLLAFVFLFVTYQDIIRYFVVR